MEGLSVCTLAYFDSQNKQEKAMEYLHEDTREEFEEDVPENEMDFFNAVDERPYPDVLKKLAKNGLFLSYDIEDDFEPVIALNELGANWSITVFKDNEMGGAFSITLSIDGKSPRMVYETVEYDDLERDSKVAAFNKVLSKLNPLNPLKTLKYLKDFVDSNKKFPYPL